MALPSPAPCRPASPSSMSRMSNGDVPPHRLHSLDGVRAVAAALVVCHHSLTDGIRRTLEGHGFPRAGHLLAAFTGSGVELFFVLSGVVLLRPYLRGHRAFEAGKYFTRRVERLWPPYLTAWVFAGLTVVYLNHFPTGFSAALPLFAWRDFLPQAAILRFTDPLYNDAWWSLAVEVLFYVVVPAVIFLGTSRRFTQRTALLLLPGVACGSAALIAFVSAKHAPWTMFYSLGTYFVCFYGGIVIAKFDLSRRTSGVLLGAGATLIAAATLLNSAVLHAGFGLLYAGLVARLISAPKAHVALAHPSMLWLGERSYSLFLLHVSVFEIANNLASELFALKSRAYFLFSRALGIPGALFAAMLLFWFVERRYARGLVTAKQFWPPLFRPVRRAPAAGSSPPSGSSPSPASPRAA